MSRPVGLHTFALTVLLSVVGCSHTSAPPPSPAEPPAATQPATTRPAAIDSFQGEYRFLSNFWPAEVVFEGITYPTAEHAYQAAKSLDPIDRQRIAVSPTPAEAKRAGRALKPREDWETAKFDVMERVVRDKFTRHADLRTQLLTTGDAQLIEGNTWGDRVWGVYQGEGENRLGLILMKVRDELH
jgi:N-glycosidase YbiA